MADKFYTKTYSRAWLIISGVSKEIRPICQEGFDNLSDRLWFCLGLGLALVVWGMSVERMIIGPEILQNCILVER